MALAAAALWAGCAGQIPSPTAVQAEAAARRWPGVTAEALDRGRSLYVVRCAGCHNLYPPAAIGTERWPGIVERMAGQAKLGPPERDLILHYLLTVGAEPAR